MRKLKFEYMRFFRSNLFYLTVGLTLLIGIVGILMGLFSYGQDAAPEMFLWSIFNSFIQFTLIVMLYVFSILFAGDYAKGIYVFMQEIGYSYKQSVINKFIVCTTVVLPIVTLFLLISSFILGVRDYNLLIIILLSANVNVVFIILFSLLLSILTRKTIFATLFGFACYLIFNVLNLIGYGLLNPADGNSIAVVSIKLMVMGTSTHNTLKNHLDFLTNNQLLTSVGIPLIYTVLMLFIIFFIIQKRRRKNEI